jgi:prepilin-type N-terminal cleavage/methylation domain-containing protein
LSAGVQLMFRVTEMKPIVTRGDGFTLVELMVAMAMSLFLMGGAILMYLSVQNTYDDTNRLSRLQENIRFASDYMVRDIRNAGFTDEIALTIGEEQRILTEFVQLPDSGDELTVRYAGRGHCQEEFDSYQVVQNTYFMEDGELHCAGRLVDADGNLTAPGGAESIALVAGLTGISFELLMADGATRVSNAETTCNEFEEVLASRCLAVLIGLEFEALRNPDSPQTVDRRFVELFATFRNSAIGHIYSGLFPEDEEDDD